MEERFTETKNQAKAGHADAQYNLGWMYADGNGVPKDSVKAVEWYQKAAEQGWAEAQTCLGLMYANGEGVPQDSTKAVEWYQKAAEQGVASAQFNLGVMYINGEGVPKDAAKAAEWWQKAAAQEHAKAQFNLGVMYSNGEGVPKDAAKAAEWRQNESHVTSNTGWKSDAINAICQSCRTSFSAEPRTTFFGFQKMTCPSCKAEVEYPLTRGYRTTYWVILGFFAALMALAVLIGRSPPGGLVIWSMPLLIALVQDRTIQKRVSATEASKSTVR